MVTAPEFLRGPSFVKRLLLEKGTPYPCPHPNPLPEGEGILSEGDGICHTPSKEGLTSWL